MTEFSDILLDFTRKNLENEEKRFHDLDNKAIAIISIIGILISFLVNSINIISSKSSISYFLFMLTALSFWIAVYFGVKVIKIRYVPVFPTKLLINQFKQEKMSDVKSIITMINASAETEFNLYLACVAKGKDLEKAIFFLGLGIALLIGYLLFSASGVSISISY